MSHVQIVGLSELKQYLGITNEDEDGPLTAIMQAANDAVEKACDRTFKSTVYTDEVYDGTGTSELILKHYPVTVLSVVKYGEASPFTTVASADYGFTSEGIITLLYGGIFDKIARYWRITYTAGYADAVMPSDLKWATTEIGVFFYKMKSRLGITSKTVAGQVVESYLANFPAHVQDILDRHKRKVLY